MSVIYGEQPQSNLLPKPSGNDMSIKSTTNVSLSTATRDTIYPIGSEIVTDE
jgi:hypothetical protein